MDYDLQYATFQLGRLKCYGRDDKNNKLNNFYIFMQENSSLMWGRLAPL